MREIPTRCAAAMHTVLTVGGNKPMMAAGGRTIRRRRFPSSLTCALILVQLQYRLYTQTATKVKKLIGASMMVGIGIAGQVIGL